MRDEDTDPDGLPVRGPLETTAKNDRRDLPGYDVGVRRGIDETLVALRFSLSEGGTDMGVAFLMAERLKQWMEVPENAELIRVTLAG